jgi:hypothetical protein
VVCDRAVCKHARISASLHPPGEVDILIVHEEAFVEDIAIREYDRF